MGGSNSTPKKEVPKVKKANLTPANSEPLQFIKRDDYDYSVPSRTTRKITDSDVGERPSSNAARQLPPMNAARQMPSNNAARQYPSTYAARQYSSYITDSDVRKEVRSGNKKTVGLPPILAPSRPLSNSPRSRPQTYSNTQQPFNNAPQALNIQGSNVDPNFKGATGRIYAYDFDGVVHTNVTDPMQDKKRYPIDEPGARVYEINARMNTSIIDQINKGNLVYIIADRYPDQSKVNKINDTLKEFARYDNTNYEYLKNHFIYTDDVPNKLKNLQVTDYYTADPSKANEINSTTNIRVFLVEPGITYFNKAKLLKKN